MKPECEEIIPGTDKRFCGNIMKIKTMKIDCNTCILNSDDCKEDEFNEDMSEYDFCTRNNQYSLWYPRFRSYFCKGCYNFGSIGGYHNTNEYDYPYEKCCGHSGPCDRNYLYYTEDQIYVTRKDDWKVVRCTKEGKEISWNFKLKKESELNEKET